MRAHGDGTPAVGFLRSVLAGIGAGVVAALGCLAVKGLMHAPTPTAAAAGSAFVAGVLGGVVYWAWSRASKRPAIWLWGTSLFFALAVSAAEKFLHPAFLPLPRGLSFLNGLVIPLADVLGALGLLRSGAGRFPRGGAPRGPATLQPPGGFRAPGGFHGAAGPHGAGGFLTPMDVMHFVVAVAAGLLIPWLAGRWAARRAEVEPLPPPAG